MKKFKFAWIVELLLFIVGFYIVYTRFLDYEPVTKVERSTDPPPTENSINVDLQQAVVCIDIDEDNNVPLLAKKSFNKYIDYLYCYSKLSTPHPRTIVHYWIYNGQLQAQKKVKVDQASHTAWSRLEMSPDKKGAWQVDIRLENGNILGSTKFKLK